PPDPPEATLSDTPGLRNTICIRADAAGAPRGAGGDTALLFCPIASTMASSLMSERATRSSTERPSRNTVQTSASARISPMRCDTSSVLMPCCASLRSEEHTSELQSHLNLVCRLLLEKKKQQNN